MTRPNAWYRNQVLGSLLGIAPVLVLSTSLFSAFLYALLYGFVLLSSHTLLYSLRSIIPLHQRQVYTLLIISFFTTLSWVLLQSFAPELVRGLGIFFALVAVQPAVLENHYGMRMETPYSYVFSNSVKSVLAILVFMLSLAALRSLLGDGSLFVWRTDSQNIGFDLRSVISQPLKFLLETSAAFLLLGIFLVIVPLDKELSDD